MYWALKNRQDEQVAPLIYTNGKTQDTVLAEVIEAFEQNDIVILQGKTGSGKSAIALSLTAYYGSGIIVVPTKVLQRQYKADYLDGKYSVTKQDGDRLNIDYMYGKGNFTCKYLGNKVLASCNETPCSCKLETNQSRLSVASKCPLWSPIYSHEYIDSPNFENFMALPYNSIRGRNVLFLRDDPCTYYKQFINYVETGAVLMNKAKWEIETLIGRKPIVPIEIIDEGDEWLDSLTFKVQFSLALFDALLKEDKIDEYRLKEARKNLLSVFTARPKYSGRIDSQISDFLDYMQEYFKNETESTKLINLLQKIAYIREYSEDAHATIEKETLSVFILKPEVTLKNIKARCGKLLIMSATVHKAEVLRSVFGLECPLIKSETEDYGIMYLKQIPNSEIITHENFDLPKFRERYNQLVDSILARAQRPTLVQVHATKYIPEKYKLMLNTGFKNGISWSTVSDRGLDLAGDACRSIVILKYPFPDLNSVVFRAMRESWDRSKFWAYIGNMADRNLIQQCGRGIRFKEDWCEVWSPDAKVIERIRWIWNGDMKIERVNI